MIPSVFNIDFLAWFRKQTEAAWATYQPASFQDYVRRRIGGVDWQGGTRWLGGLEDQELARIERQWNLVFPPDYRRFLTRLHAVDRPMVGAGFIESAAPGQYKSTLVPIERPAFYNWLLDGEALQRAWTWLVDGLQFDIAHNDLWLPSWGTKPTSIEAQEARVKELVAAAPRLIPVFAHRYLLADPSTEDNPVFSIYQSDIVVFAPDVRSYLLLECGDLLRLDVETLRQTNEANINAHSARYSSIPFWGELWDS